MAHFAKIEGGSVVQVLVVNNAELMDEDAEVEAKGIAFLQSLYGADTQWVQTSYNASIRKNFAGIGYAYDAGRDAFIPPKPFPSWTLDDATCQWSAPVAYPSDGGSYRWDEDSGEWVEA